MLVLATVRHLIKQQAQISIQISAINFDALCSLTVCHPASTLSLLKSGFGKINDHLKAVSRHAWSNWVPVQTLDSVYKLESSALIQTSASHVCHLHRPLCTPQMRAEIHVQSAGLTSQNRPVTTATASVWASVLEGVYRSYCAPPPFSSLSLSLCVITCNWCSPRDDPTNMNPCSRFFFDLKVASPSPICQ